MFLDTINAVVLMVLMALTHAAPLPPPTGYSSIGMPAFAQGSLRAPGSSAAITIIPGQGSVSQVLSSDSTVNTVITSYNSYECIDPFTFRAQGTASSFTAVPEIPAAVPGLKGEWCGIIFFNGTHMAIKANPTLFGNCPDSILPPAADTGGNYSEYILIPGIVPTPNVSICSSPGVPNLTSFPRAPSPSPTPTPTPTPTPVLPLPMPSLATKPGPVNMLAYPGSGQPQYGLWGTKGVFMYHSLQDMCATRFEDDNALRAQIAQFSSFQCTGPDYISFYQTFNLTEYYAIDTTVPRFTMSLCLAGSRNNTDGTLTVYMTPFGPCPAAVEMGPNSPGVIEVLTTSLIGPIPGNPDVSCINPPEPEPTPEPSPEPEDDKRCTWKGTWNIALYAAPCSAKKFAFKPKVCTNTSVMLRTVRQLGKNAKSQTTFGLDATYSSKDGPGEANEIAVIRGCTTRQLGGPSIGIGKGSSPTLDILKIGVKWNIVPQTDDCTSAVNLIAASGIHKGKYLRVAKPCDAFTWANSDGQSTRFKLNKVSELLGR